MIRFGIRTSFYNSFSKVMFSQESVCSHEDGWVSLVPGPFWGVSMTSGRVLVCPGERMVHVKLECFAVFLFDKFIDQHICTV